MPCTVQIRFHALFLRNEWEDEWMLHLLELTIMIASCHGESFYGPHEWWCLVAFVIPLYYQKNLFEEEHGTGWSVYGEETSESPQPWNLLRLSFHTSVHFLLPSNISVAQDSPLLATMTYFWNLYLFLYIEESHIYPFLFYHLYFKTSQYSWLSL